MFRGDLWCVPRTSHRGPLAIHIERGMRIRSGMFRVDGPGPGFYSSPVTRLISFSSVSSDALTRIYKTHIEWGELHPVVF